MGCCRRLSARLIRRVQRRSALQFEMLLQNATIHYHGESSLERTPSRFFINHSLLKPNGARPDTDRKSTRLNSSHSQISYAVFCLKKKKHPLPSTDPEALHS